MQTYRHGDLVFVEMGSIGKEADASLLKPAHDYVLAGNDSAPHTLRGDILISCAGEGAERVHTVRLSQDTTVDHAGRHTSGTLPAGDYLVAALIEGAQRASVVD